jgi:hypothetical protein
MCVMWGRMSVRAKAGATTAAAAANGGKQHNALSCHHPPLFFLPFQRLLSAVCVPMLRLSAPPD